jgi:hypothetical protein
MCPNRFIFSDLLANMRLSPVHSSDEVKELLFGQTHFQGQHKVENFYHFCVILWGFG